MARFILSLFICWSLTAPLHLGAQQMPPPMSTVYYGSDPGLMTGYDPNPLAVMAMTDDLVVAVTGQKSLAAAWRSLVSPSDHIGIKISASGGRDFSTHRAIVEAVLHGLVAAGIPMTQVVIWDRADPRDAGYQPLPGGPAIRDIEPFTGYEPKALAQLPATGRLIWGDVAFSPRAPNPLDLIRTEQYSVDSHWSRLICGINKIINIPVMSANEDCGVAGCIYNVTVPNLDNWRRFVNPPQCGNPFLGELYSDPHVAHKVVLNIMDGLIAQYGGGPDWQPGYSWTHASLYASKDPVAIDATALRQIETWRKLAKLPPVTDHAKYLETAAAMALGNYAEDRIALVKEGR